ncbi:hypothetical protein GQ53DRAFT_804117 [Thozetella sp. PMI_491]|nr:hypothetical protein GQ53DRAFT_804117 [Thozetella sp. PMI_491]
MPPKTLSDKDLVVLALAWRCFKGQPEVSGQTYAIGAASGKASRTLCGARNDKAAYKRLWDVKQKLFAMTTDGDHTSTQGEASASPAAAPATPAEKKKRGRPAKKAAQDEPKEDGDELTAGSPPKRRRLPKKAAQEETSELEEADSDASSTMGYIRIWVFRCKG